MPGGRPPVQVVAGSRCQPACFLWQLDRSFAAAPDLRLFPASATPGTRSGSTTPLRRRGSAAGRPRLRTGEWGSAPRMAVRHRALRAGGALPASARSRTRSSDASPVVRSCPEGRPTVASGPRSGVGWRLVTPSGAGGPLADRTAELRDRASVGAQGGLGR